MKSPFPGMDPYLEPQWLDLHARLIIASSNQIEGQLGDDLVARVEQRVVVEDTYGYPRRRIAPDVHVVDTRSSSRQTAAVAVVSPVAATTQAVHLTEMLEPLKQRYLEIIDVAAGGRVITVMEFVSPSNKNSRDGAKQYREKQDDCFNARVNLVEVDLTRGDRTLLCHRWSNARLYESTYQASVWRASQPQGVDLYSISIRDRLPEIPVPLRPGDVDATLNLQVIFDECYARGRYGRTIDYSQPPDPPLGDDDSAWARQLLEASRSR